MQPSGTLDVRVKCFDVPPLEGGADLRRAEPMWAILDPPPSPNWTDLFHDLVAEADPLLRAAHPRIEDGHVVFFPGAARANGTCILLKGLILDVNSKYRVKGFGNEEDAARRRHEHAALQHLAGQLNAETVTPDS
jgi:hypothetical protein